MTMTFPGSFLALSREAWDHQYLHGHGTWRAVTRQWTAYLDPVGATWRPGMAYDGAELGPLPPLTPGSSLLAPAWWTPAALAAGLRLDHSRSGWVCLREDRAAKPRKGKKLPAVTFERVTNLRDATRFKTVFSVSAPQAVHLWGSLGQLVDEKVEAWIVSVKRGVAVGTILLFHGDRVASAHMLSVIPAWRKRGVGEATLREVVRRAFKEPTVAQVHLEMMPEGNHIPKRLGAHELMRFGWWRKT